MGDFDGSGEVEWAGANVENDGTGVWDWLPRVAAFLARVVNLHERLASQSHPMALWY